MFTNDKKLQSVADAVKKVMGESVKIPTATGTKVLGSRYGNSAKAAADQTKAHVDKLSGPTDKEITAKKPVKESFASRLIEGIKRSDVPASVRKARGDKPLTTDEVKSGSKDSISDTKTLAKNRGVKEEVEIEEGISALDASEKKRLLNQKLQDKGHQTYKGEPVGYPARKAAAKKLAKEDVEQIDEAYEEIKVHSKEGKHIGTITHGKYQSVAYAHPTTKFGATKEPADDEAGMQLDGPHDTQKGIDFIHAHHRMMTEQKDPGSWSVEEPWKDAKKNVTDKSGAVHTPLSRAKDLARSAFKKIKKDHSGK